MSRKKSRTVLSIASAIGSSQTLAPLRAIALGCAILAATSGPGRADPFRTQPAANADQSRAGRFETMPVRQASGAPRYGGGFIEFLLSGAGGGAGVASPVQAAYAPMTPETDPSRAAVD